MLHMEFSFASRRSMLPNVLFSVLRFSSLGTDIKTEAVQCLFVLSWYELFCFVAKLVAHACTKCRPVIFNSNFSTFLKVTILFSPPNVCGLFDFIFSCALFPLHPSSTYGQPVKYSKVRYARHACGHGCLSLSNVHLDCVVCLDKVGSCTRVSCQASCHCMHALLKTCNITSVQYVKMPLYE